LFGRSGSSKRGKAPQGLDLGPAIARWSGMYSAPRPERFMSNAREAIVSLPPPPLGAQLRRAFDDDELASPSDDQERYVREDEDGYSG